MNFKLVENWNSVVQKDDRVFHLGDVGRSKFKELRGLIKSLNGYKILYMGHHDFLSEDSLTYWRNIGFKEVFPHGYAGYLYSNIVMCHYPIQTPHLQYDKLGKSLRKVLDSKDIDYNLPLICLHGHIHKMKRGYHETVKSSQRINVGVDFNDYTPLSIDEIMIKIQS